ncbi:Protein TPX2 [Capsicum annuum]|uniref:Protein TPX2 n=1 Tax=Capsicum annuum TaxID=4072 RepID=A0A2G2Z491_CAPAN|nr:Protein TPX2 [Capsicum annuum]
MADGKDDTNVFVIDEIYEFSAPRFYDFMIGETEEDMRKAELWFEINSSYAPSPCMPRIKTSRSVQVEIPCDLTEGENLQSTTRPAAEVVEDVTPDENRRAAKVLSTEVKEDVTPNEEKSAAKILSSDVKDEVTPNENKPTDKVLSSEVKEEVTPNENKPAANVLSSEVKEEVTPNDAIRGELDSSLPNPESVEKQPTSQEICTPRPPPPPTSKKIDPRKTDSNNQKTAKKISSMLRNPSALKSKTLHVKSSNPASVRKQAIMRNAAGTPNFGQENQAIKRQKLESGKAKQILDVKPQNLPHKTKPGVNGSTFSSVAKPRREDRKMYVREPVPQFISTAEMMKKFQSSTREMSLSCMSTSRRKPNKLTLTAPKEPEFETVQRVRPTTVKSSAELEEEMMAKIPRFKARPLNKKILEAPNLPALPKSTPQLPEFKEFHLSTMTRANQNAETSSVLSSIESTQSNQWKPHLTAPKSPVLQTSLRARPPQIKSSEELEKEELEKVPKFKARPLNKKIFESKGDLGMFCNTKKQVTVPEEFHFATDERIPPPANVTDLFDKLSLISEPTNEKTIPRNTRPNPFHLYTEERGAEKERKLFTELLQKQTEEERSRVPKATPYPYTTDYPVIPPKPEPKHCTKPEPFQLESLVRHEREMQKELEERLRLEKEEAMMRTFKAQPVLIEDPIPVPEKVRKPLTQVQEFNLKVDHRATDRAEFDKKMKEKEMMYQRYREEAEAARMMEEEMALKQLRKTLVPHARPVPKFDHPFQPQKSSKKVTKPRSPKLLILKRQERRKMACPYAAVSSAASQMR